MSYLIQNRMFMRRLLPEAFAAQRVAAVDHAALAAARRAHRDIAERPAVRAGPCRPVESHAWAAVQVPGAGWVEQDPTHPGAVGDRYIRIAVGRDHADVVPITGTYPGGATDRMDVQVELREMEVAAPA